MKTQTL